jgi:hypothetical protein
VTPLTIGSCPVTDSKEGVAERVKETELASEDIQDCIVVASDNVWLDENKDEDDSDDLYTP